MLCLSRKKNESIQIGENIFITVIEIQRGYVRLGIDAPKSIAIVRTEIKERPNREE